MTETVTIVSRTPRRFRMSLSGDRRTYEIAQGANIIDRDFLSRWLEANFDSDLIDVLSLPDKPATRRAGAHERGTL